MCVGRVGTKNQTNKNKNKNKNKKKNKKTKNARVISSKSSLRLIFVVVVIIKVESGISLCSLGCGRRGERACLSGPMQRQPFTCWESRGESFFGNGEGS